MIIINLKITNVMKIFKFLLLTLLAIQLCACSSNDSNELVEHNKMQNTAPESHPSDDEIIDVHSYVEERPNIFGNVLILNDYNELDAILSEMDNSTLQDLRVLYNNLGFYSPILESHVIYDSIFTNVVNSYGLSEDDIINLEDYNDDLNDAIFEEFKSTIMEYSNLILCSNYENETFIEPIGDPWTIEGIYNEKNIFIVDKYVHSFNHDLIYTIPIQYFNDSIAHMSPENLIQYVQDIANNGENAYIITKKSPFIHREKDGKYKMTLRIRTFDLARYDGEIIRHLHVNIRNFKNGCLKCMPTEINLACGVKSYDAPESIPICIAINETRNIYWKTYKTSQTSGMTINGSDFFILDYLRCNISNSADLKININYKH